MFLKRFPLFIIDDHLFNAKKRRIKRRFLFAYISTIILTFTFSLSLLFMVIILSLLSLIKKIVIPNYHHQIQLYSDKFIYIFKRNTYSFEYDSVAYIDQDVIEFNDAYRYNSLSLIDEQMNTLLTIDGRNFNYDDLVGFCQFIQDTNISTRNNYYNRDEQFLAAVTEMDNENSNTFIQ